MLFFTIFLFLPYILTNTNGEQITKFPSTFRQNDFTVTKLKDTNYLNAHPEDEEPEKVDLENECKKYSKKEMEEISKTYKSDGGRIKTVSANALPASTEDLKKIQCLQEQLKAKSQEAYLTTTFDLNEPLNSSQVHLNQKRRGNEYQFDTVEYYDDVISFDDAQCPDAVDVVTLQVLDIRPYDIECELLCEWTSLE